MSARRKEGDCALASVWLRRLGDSYFGAWLLDVFQTPMASAAATGPAPSTGGGPLSFMGCMREASPPSLDEHQHQRPVGLPTGELPPLGGHGFDSMPKEPKKRRFHPLRGLRRIFRKKSRGAADTRLGGPGPGLDRELNGEHVRDREEVTLKDPAGRPEEIRSRSASELLTDSCDRDRLFLQRRGIEESFVNLQRGAVGQLSISHDSVFPGEVPQTRPLSSLDTHGSLERRPAKVNGNEADQKESYSAQRHRISLRVFEQIKTVIENRNQVAAAGTTATTTTTGTTTGTTTTGITTTTGTGTTTTTTTTTTTAIPSTPTEIANSLHVPRKDAPTPTNLQDTETHGSTIKEDLPELKVGCLNHNAALHRINVRPKNRRPPRRSNSQSSSANNSSIGQHRIDSISENSIDTLDSLETSAESTTDRRPISILRKSSSRVSRTSTDEPVVKSPSARRPTLSPDSLSSSPEAANVPEVPDETPKPLPRTSNGQDVRRASSRLSKSPDSLESGSHGWLAKPHDSFDELLAEADDLVLPRKPVAATRRLLRESISKSQERVCQAKSTDSLEDLNSDDFMERRRASFEIRPIRTQVHKLMSKSTECFEAGLLSRQRRVARPEEARKRTSLSEMNLSGTRLLGKPLSESAESIERMAPSPGKPSDGVRRLGRRTAHSSESSDNLDLDDGCRMEIRARARRSTPKRLGDGFDVAEVALPGKPSSRMQKSSESSELGSTDTLDSERRNTTKSSDSDETLDSLEKELQDRSQDIRDVDTMDKLEEIEVVVEEPEEEEEDEDEEEEVDQELEEEEDEEEEEVDHEEDGSYWRRHTDSQDNPRGANNLDIHQLLAYTLVSRVQENGNNELENHDENRPGKNICGNSPVVLYPKKRQHHQMHSTIHSTIHATMQQQSSSEDNKTLGTTINNLLSSKTDEALQNMLNGNISEVSTDTKSFKEKLIMFEKLGK